MQNTSPRVVGRRALIKGTAMLAVAATARAQGQPPPAEQATPLADVPLGPSVTVTVERRGDIVLVGLNRPFIQNRIDPPTRLRLAATYYQYEHDASLRALVLFGHGENFSRGIDDVRPESHRTSMYPCASTRSTVPSSRGAATHCAVAQEHFRPTREGFNSEPLTAG